MSSVKSFQCISLVLKLLVLATLLGVPVIQVGCLEFSYLSFPKVSREDFFLTGLSDINWEAIQVTRDSRGASIANLSGRVCYKKKFKLWSTKGKENITASFNSTFVLNITPETDPGGEGLAFILAGDRNVPDNSQGQWMGIVNASTNGSRLSNIVAVEFDTKKSYLEDIDDNHVGVDVNSIYSIQQASLGVHGINLSSRSNVTVSIRYDGVFKTMNIFVFMDNATGDNLTNPIISIPDLDLSNLLPEDVFVGFSASTGKLNTQLNCVLSWDFTAMDIAEDSVNLLLVIGIVVPATVLILMSGIAYYIYRKSKSQKVEVQERDTEIEIEIQSSATAPQKFQLKELQSATQHFSLKNKLGEGGFGTVYKGFLNNKEVAVKRISKNSRQGKQEFIAEVKTIGSLHHKNLVKLVGWCYESNEFVLVYDFMPNGSLDKLIFGNEKAGMEGSTLSWERRHGIIGGVAQALDYLHNGCSKKVLHRDIKASNIMLDSEFNARLGDFGLARTIQLRDQTHHSTREIAGTPGYMAPESFHIGRATVETDVYAFGILILEVACGRKPGNPNEQNNYINGIVEWVWELHRTERIIDAIDFRLDGEFEKEQAECVLLLGLACCHPNPYQRPSMRTALQVLTGEAAPPLVPIEKPVFMWPASMPPSFSEYSEYSATGGQFSPFSELGGR